MAAPSILVTGATGYIGGRLVPALLEAGHDVRCVARTPSKLDAVEWRDQVEVVEGSVTDLDAMTAAMQGVRAAYYLVHSMGHTHDFAERDRVAAGTFRIAAEQAGVEQIVYLGGLGDKDDGELSSHLRSRHEVGRTLAAGTVPVTELRAAVIIGSGSASFEMLRNLVEVLPAMITPRWVRTRCQPIAVRDILHYLVKSIETPAAAGRIFEVGGPDVVTYEDMMRIHAEVAGLRRRLIVPVPVLSPSLSSHWVGLVTSLPRDLAKPLVASLQNEVIVNDHAIDDVIPLETTPFRRALELALHRVADLAVPTRWSSATLPGRDPAEPLPTDPDWAGGTLLEDERTITTTASADALYATVSGIGGDRGWFVADLLWTLRGWIDSVVGGVGMRRGRRHPDDVRVGDAIDFWRVETTTRPSLLRLRAEMKLPGEAWLEWSIVDDESTRRLVQRAIFFPRGLLGRAYWYSLVPFHAVIFGALSREIVGRAEALPLVASASATTVRSAERPKGVA